MSGFKNLTFHRMNLQPQSDKILLNGTSGIFEKFPVIVKKRKIIDIADVLFHFELLFDNVIKTVQIDIRKKLTGQIANRQSSPALKRRQQIITWKIRYHRFLFVTMVNNSIDQPERVKTFSV